MRKMRKAFCFLLLIISIVLLVISCVYTISDLLEFSLFAVFVTAIIAFKSLAPRYKGNVVQERIYKFNNSLTSCIGFEKMVEIETFVQKQYDQKTDELLKSRYDDLVELNPQKELNWATIGGAVSGVAGGVAGVVAAANVMEQNQKIRQRNAERRDLQELGMLCYVYKLQELKEKRPVVHNINYFSEQYSICYEYSAETLFNQIKFSEPKVVCDWNSGAVAISVGWECNRSFYIDGTIRAKLYSQSNECLGCIILSFPLTGTKNKKGVLEGVSIHHVHVEDYKIVLEPIDLWAFTEKNKKIKGLKSDGMTEEDHKRIRNKNNEKYLSEVIKNKRQIAKLENAYDKTDSLGLLKNRITIIAIAILFGGSAIFFGGNEVLKAVKMNGIKNHLLNSTFATAVYNLKVFNKDGLYHNTEGASFLQFEFHNNGTVTWTGYIRTSDSYSAISYYRDSSAYYDPITYTEKYELKHDFFYNTYSADIILESGMVLTYHDNQIEYEEYENKFTVPDELQRTGTYQDGCDIEYMFSDLF